MCEWTGDVVTGRDLGKERRLVRDNESLPTVITRALSCYLIECTLGTVFPFYYQYFACFFFGGGEGVGFVCPFFWCRRQFIAMYTTGIMIDDRARYPDALLS